ncbi:glycoside hydrolase family 15 protein [Cohnella suwonensis]|uniref:Glycoside hydrolase family 15 protein n=1 Tax=Cohnella suwonensis TaxID=696072 RepID=A0ABW0LW38_9BACL
MRESKGWKKSGMVALAAVLLGTTLQMLAPVVHADPPTSPSTQSATSLYMSNWTDSMNIWMASKLSQNDTGTFGPRIGEMRISNDFNTNQIKDYSGFFRDESHSVKYDQIHNFNSEAYYDDGGILRTKYLDYNGSSMPVTVTKDYAMVPNQNFTVATYTFTNAGGSAVNYNLLEQIHVNNKTIGGANSTNSASYDSTRNALIVNMSNSGQYYVALGAFQTATGYQAGDDTVSNTSSSTVAPWYTFDNNGTLKNNASVTATDISVAFQNSITIPANGSVTLSFVATVRDTLAHAQSSIDTARAQTASYWFTQTQNSYATWLSGGKSVSFADDGINKTYKRSLIAIKNSINPVSGAMPAATNPIAYGYKVWARDSAVTAMILDQAGFTADAEKYWYWLKDRQQSDGSFKTTFNLWDSSYVSFVEPEHDSIGIYLIGAYLHYKITGSSTFLTNIWTSYKKSADFIYNAIGTDPYGFGPADASIWEETVEYNIFTQSLYATGLDSAQYMARAKTLPALADNYNGVASQIRTNINKSDSWSPKGMWNGTSFNRAVSTSGTANTLVDASSMAALVYGTIDSASSRASSHVSTVLSHLQHDTYGIARYDSDNFYYTSPYSPAGNEAQSDEPSWPQMTSYHALYSIYNGDLTTALAELKWMVSRMGVGYMAPGEAVSRITLKPLPSTMVEPVTAAWFVVTALAYGGQADLRVIPPQENVGAYKAITVTTTVSNDLSQYSNVPYYLDNNASVSGSGDTDIQRVYISNDASNLYVRIKNKSGSLSAYNTAPRFAMMVYAEDYKHGAAASLGTGMYGGTLDHSAQYMVGRWSDSSTYAMFKVSGGTWTFDHFITSVIAPQWSTSSGDIEMVIPLSELSSTGAVATGDYSNLNVVLVRQNPSTSAWSEDDVQALHDRKMTTGEAWFYGNVQ